MFFNRKIELKRLEERYASDQAQLIIMYGRRRVGKTELLRQFVKDKPHIYFLADLSVEQEQLRQFTEKISLFANDESLMDNPFANWGALFSYLENISRKQRLVVVIDEYQYLLGSNRAISSIIQKSWDSGLKDTRIFWVLCGSYISLMEHELLAYKSPLYGRRTGQFYVEPLNFFESSQFLTRYGIKDKIRAYGMLGGIPAYLLQFDSKQTVDENIVNNFLYTDSFLYNETRFLLLEELREPRKYFAILKAIAFGANKINEIVQKSGVERSAVPRYLEILQNLKIIHREVSVTEEKPEKSRKAIYEINDFYFKFWFRFIMPNQSFIEENRQRYVLAERILPFLDQYLGSIFERVSIDFLKQINGTNRFPFVFEKIGRYWKANVEMDIVAFDSSKKNFFFAECKWSEKKIGTNILDELIAKSKAIIDENKPKKVFYGFFSKSGFTENLKRINRDDVLLFQLKDFRQFC